MNMPLKRIRQSWPDVSCLTVTVSVTVGFDVVVLCPAIMPCLISGCPLVPLSLTQMSAKVAVAL